MIISALSIVDTLNTHQQSNNILHMFQQYPSFPLHVHPFPYICLQFGWITAYFRAIPCHHWYHSLTLLYINIITTGWVVAWHHHWIPHQLEPPPNWLVYVFLLLLLLLLSLLLLVDHSLYSILWGRNHNIWCDATTHIL